ncbi:MAG TPA: methyltransferase domain-containing protein [Candidatus Kapabacteria bacterium]|nr:methyltransferase domain-containing protein [Candidatus Kapabacteria bacterium]
MEKYFSKHFEVFDLDTIDYWKCESCGFTAAKTLFDMSAKEWEVLNEKFHSSYHFTDQCDYDANWTERLKLQAKTLASLNKVGLIHQNKPWLDYGCGDGKLSQFLERYSLKLNNYDEYIGKHTTNVLDKNDLKREGFDLVISTSVFEHVRNIEILNEMENLVSQEGCFAIHTLVREEIPDDPKWFYLLPVHCSLFTNKSMQILFERWGYKFSMYHVPSRLWFWYKEKPRSAGKITESLNKEEAESEYFVKNDFMDYWK